MMVWPYILFAGVGNKEYEIMGMPLFYVYCALIIAVCVINLINAVVYKSEKLLHDLAFWSMIIKLVHIPFYVLVYLLGILMIPSMLFVPMTFITPFIILFLVVVDVLFMVSSSSYMLKGIWTAKNKEIISKGVAIVLTIFCFVFVGDVICAILFYRKIKQRCNI